MESTAFHRSIKSIIEIMPKTLKTCLWLIRLTATITLAVQILQYINVIEWLSQYLNPIFNLIGLPGEASLAFVSGYFVNVYSAIAVMATLDLDIRAITILSAMILCSHNMITETAVQKKTGSSAIRMVITRTVSAFIIGFALNYIMPESATSVIIEKESIKLTFMEMLEQWFYSTLKLAAMMSVLIVALSILQRLLSEFGVIKLLSKLLRPILYIFGLPAKTSFLWIVANTLGLAYGAAVMIDEAESGKITQKDIDLLNHHIGISHSNLEDVILLASIGAMAWWLLLSRWALSFLLVWELRLEMAIKKKFLPL